MDMKQWNAEGYDSHFKSDCHIGVKILIGVVALLLLAACGGVTPVPTPAPTSAPTSTAAPTSTPRPEWTTPHPILSDVRVRRAIAYCTNKDELIESVYPLLTPEERESLVMDSFVPRDHWAYAGQENIETYPFDQAKGAEFLEEAGWTLRRLGEIRVNKKGEQLTLKLETTTATFRKTWTAVWVEQMKKCGILINIYLPPAKWWFDDSIIGQEWRDFELKTLAWVTQANPGGRTLYACDEIPLPGNDWSGQNYMGWCNPLASENIIRAEQTLLRQEKIDAYRIVQQEFTKDMVSLPLFNRTETYAMNPNLQGVELRAGDWYYTWNIADWEIPGRDSITLGFTQEPYSLFTIVEDAHVANLAESLIEGVKFASKNYDFFSVTQKQMPTLENGLATSKIVQLQEGDWVFGEDFERWSSVGELKPGVKYWDANGNLTEYKGGIVSSNQLTVKYEFVDGLTWSDGVPVTKADFELYHKIACDEDSGATSFITCDSIQTIEFTDNGYTISWVPGLQDSSYYIAPFGFYPAHRVLSDGRLLADLPAKEWATTPEVTRNPIGAGPYVLKDWIPGDRMVFEANPYYYGGEPKTKTIIIKFLHANIAEASLIAGDVDLIDSTTFVTVSPELRYAEREGLVKIVVIPSATWEHIDMNLYIK